MKQALPYRECIRRVLYTLWLVCLSSALTGQLSRPGNPVPLTYGGAKPIVIYDIAASMKAKSGEMTQERHPWLKSDGSGFVSDVHFDLVSSGTWDTLADGTKLWRAGFRVRDAAAVNVVFNDFSVQKGVRIYLYDEIQQQVLGAFSDLNNKPGGVLATAQVNGELVIVEVSVPAYVGDAISLTVAQIGYAFADTSGQTELKAGWFGLSGECNEDINCYDEIRIRQLKYAVARIVYDGGERCTGSLVNNMLQDGRDYLLTAAHCISDEQTANTAVFCFDYESPFCDGPDGNNRYTISGATIRAEADGRDMVLLELLEPVPFFYHPYYAGWTRDYAPPSSGITIHHPRGDVKKIAMEEHALSEETFSSEFLEDSHWLVSHWEAGTTEAGSSGAAFFDQNDRIAGTLTGGQAQCGNSVNDYYQQFSSCWDFLGPWLDPLHMTPDAMNGYDPYGAFWASGDTLSNIGQDELLVLEKEGLQWGSLSGHNSGYVTRFAERYTTANPLALFGLLLHVADNTVASATSHLTIRIYDGGNVPGALLAEKEILLADLSADAGHMIQMDSIVTVADTFFVGYEIYYEHPMDTFSVWMAGSRFPSQFSTAFVHDGAQWVSLAAYTAGTVYSSFDISPVVFDAQQLPGGETGTGSPVRVYPNPAADEVFVEFLEMSPATVELQLFDTRGRLMFQQNFPPYQTLIRLQTAQMTSGVYFLKVSGGNGPFTVKIVMIR